MSLDINLLNELGKIEFNCIQFDSILKFIDQIRNAKIDNTGEITAITLADLRDDTVKPSFTQAQALGNAPRHDGQYIIVPKVVE